MKGIYKMKKTDIANVVANVRGVSKNEAAEIVDLVIDTIKAGIKGEGEVDLHGFVKFTRVHKDATTARSPKTGEKVQVAAKDVPKCKFSTVFKKELL